VDVPTTRPKCRSRSGNRARQRSRADPIRSARRRIIKLAFQLPNGHTADVVADALAAKIVELPEQLRCSLTWDQGKEMAEHARFSVDSGVTVYFCDPRSPWQRGTNEHTNGLLRQYFPKRSDLTVHTQKDLDRVATELNDRPRRTLGWMSPSEALDEAMR
jgi:transposase, IS30 family